jgi:hypothetical protein
MTHLRGTDTALSIAFEAAFNRIFLPVTRNTPAQAADNCAVRTAEDDCTPNTPGKNSASTPKPHTGRADS